MPEPIIYLDNAATSWPKPQRVIDAMSRFLAEEAGNPGRSGHRLSLAAQRIVNEVRVKLARLVGATDPNRIVHAFNCTDALNIAIKGSLRQGDHVICTVLDHNSVSRPLQGLVDAAVITLTRVGFESVGQRSSLPSRKVSKMVRDSNQRSEGTGKENLCPTGVKPVSDRFIGFIDPEDIRRAVTPQTRLITIPHASNVIGTIQPVAEIGRIAREAGALLLVDAAQSAGVVDINVEAMNIDLFAAPGHKSLQGPPGTGFLYVGPRADVQPWREGGTGSDSTRPRQPRDLPTRLEAGTLNTVGLAGLSAALDELFESPAGQTLAHERRLLHQFYESLIHEARIRFIGPPPSDQTVGVLSFLIEGLSPIDAAAILDESFQIAVRAGLHCAPFAHEALGTLPDGTVRISPGALLTEEELDSSINAVRQLLHSI